MVRSERRVPDYDAMFNEVRQRRQEYSGKQAGDPSKAAQVLLKIASSQPHGATWGYFSQGHGASPFAG
jgi:hypothetical protein